MQYYAHYADVVKDAAFGMPLAPDVSEAVFSSALTTLSLLTYNMFLASVCTTLGVVPTLDVFDAILCHLVQVLRVVGVVRARARLMRHFLVDAIFAPDSNSSRRSTL